MRNSRVDTKMSSVPAQNDRGAGHGNALCWAARMVSLLPGIGYTEYVCIETAFWAGTYGDVWDIVQTAVWLFCLLVLPGLIAWRWHLAGGCVMMLESSANILMIAVSIATSESHTFLDLDRSYVLRIILPIWVAMLVGSGLHLLAWARETRREQLTHR